MAPSRLVERRWRPDDGDDAIVSPPTSFRSTSTTSSSSNTSNNNNSTDEGSLVSTSYYSFSGDDDHTHVSFDHCTVNTLESESTINTKDSKDSKKKKSMRSFFRRGTTASRRGDDGIDTGVDSNGPHHRHHHVEHFYYPRGVPQLTPTSPNHFSKLKMKETKKAWNDLNVGFGSLMMD